MVGRICHIFTSKPFQRKFGAFALLPAKSQQTPDTARFHQRSSLPLLAPSPLPACFAPIMSRPENTAPPEIVRNQGEKKDKEGKERRESERAREREREREREAQQQRPKKKKKEKENQACNDCQLNHLVLSCCSISSPKKRRDSCSLFVCVCVC